MFVIRPLSQESARAIERFIFDDTLGITSLPRNKRALHQKLISSLSSFTKTINVPHNEQYYFVLENTRTGEIGGICGIESKIGSETPHYNYRVEKVLAPDTDWPIPRKQLILHRRAEESGPTEIGSLYILPSFRKEGLGRLLSLSRFLFMACFPQRFEKKVVAEMRGFIDDEKKSPFWSKFGRHFLEMDFETLMTNLEDIKASIPLITPQHPIYVSLLDHEAQEAIGCVHLDSQPALNLLMQEGFSLTNEIDLFDGGPKVEVSTKEIRTVKHSREVTIQELTLPLADSEKYILCNQRLNFICCYGQLTIIDDGHASIPVEVARALGVGVGDKIRYITPFHSNNTQERS